MSEQIKTRHASLSILDSFQLFWPTKYGEYKAKFPKDLLNKLQTYLGANRWERLTILRIKSTAKMQEYILITDVSLNTYSIFRAKKTLNIILSY